VIRRTWLFSPSALALFTPRVMAARMPSRCLRMVLATLTKEGRRERVALEHHRSSSAPVSSVSRSPAKMARKVSLRGSSLFGVAYGDCDVSVVTVLGS